MAIGGGNGGARRYCRKGLWAIEQQHPSRRPSSRKTKGPAPLPLDGDAAAQHLPEVFTWNVFIQIENVALKAVGLPEEGTIRIGGRRERLRTIPSPPPRMHMGTINYRPESQAQGRETPKRPTQ